MTKHLPPPVPPHQPHDIIVVYRHDSLSHPVLLASCTQGTCRAGIGHMSGRLKAAGMVGMDVDPDPSLQFWDADDVLRTMAYLKLAEFEGRQGTVDWARARLVDLARTRSAA
jgi:hypothetical protein